MKLEDLNMIECTAVSGRQRGVSLLEVLVAIVVFAIGLLAIASLQGNLMRSGSEAKARTVGSSLAMDFLEEVRTFVTDDDFDDIIVGRTELITESGVEFQRQAEVLGYRYDRATGALVECTGADPCAADPSLIDAKRISVTVSWCDAQSGTGCDPAVLDPADADLKPHTIVIEDVVARANSPVGSARALTQLTPRSPPRVPYKPGDAPSTISIDLGDGSKRESPEPELTTTRTGSQDAEAQGVNTITRLSAITYNTLADGSVTVQQQEFLAANCTCSFGADPNLSSEQNVGHTPLVWDGDDWVGRVKVEGKPVGHFPGFQTSASQRGTLCRHCCRDHHDAPAGTTFEFSYVNQDGDAVPRDVPVGKYNPFRDHAKSGNHDHFNGRMERVESGTYLEACRFARVDGDLQLTSDFRLENLKVLPATTTDSSQTPPFESWIEGYQLFVKDFVDIFADVVTSDLSGTYPAETPQRDNPDTEEVEGPLPHGLDEPYNLPTTDTMPKTGEVRTMVARAMYIDYLHPILQERVDCRLGRGDGNCRKRDLDNGEGSLPPILPIMPFYEVNVALQANWAEVGPRPLVVNVTDQPVADGDYSRGEVTRADINGARTDIVATIEQGNIGLTDTHDITPFDCQDPGRLFVDGIRYTGNGSAAAPAHTVKGCFVIEASLIQGNVIAPSDLNVRDAFGNDCSGTLGDNFYQCEIKAIATDDGSNVIVVSNYSTNQVNNKVCLGPLAEGGFEGGTVSNDGTKSETTTFDFGANDTDWELNMQVVRQSGSSLNCPPGQLK